MRIGQRGWVGTCAFLGSSVRLPCETRESTMQAFPIFIVPLQRHKGKGCDVGRNTDDGGVSPPLSRYIYTLVEGGGDRESNLPFRGEIQHAWPPWPRETSELHPEENAESASAKLEVLGMMGSIIQALRSTPSIDSQFQTRRSSWNRDRVQFSSLACFATERLIGRRPSILDTHHHVPRSRS